jgi:hypothetical protein
MAKVFQIGPPDIHGAGMPVNPIHDPRQVFRY